MGEGSHELLGGEGASGGGVAVLRGLGVVTEGLLLGLEGAGVVPCFTCADVGGVEGLLSEGAWLEVLNEGVGLLDEALEVRGKLVAVKGVVLFLLRYDLNRLLLASNTLLESTWSPVVGVTVGVASPGLLL